MRSLQYLQKLAEWTLLTEPRFNVATVTVDPSDDEFANIDIWTRDTRMTTVRCSRKSTDGEIEEELKRSLRDFGWRESSGTPQRVGFPLQQPTPD
jgi:hypothetical protein